MKTKDFMFKVKTDDFLEVLKNSDYARYTDECKKKLKAKEYKLADAIIKTEKIFPYNIPGFEKEFVMFLKEKLEKRK